MKITCVNILLLSFMAFSIGAFGNITEQEEKMWEVNDVGSLKLFDGASALDLNDNGTVLLKSNSEKIWAIGNKESCATILPKLPTTSPQASEIIWQKINNSGLVIGSRTILKHDRPSIMLCTPELITWSQSEGLKQYSIFSATHENYIAHIEVAQCWNSSSVVISVDDRIIKLQNDQAIDLSPRLLKAVQGYGINYYTIKWKAFAVNDNDIIFGKFECFEKHPYKEKPIFVNEKFFLWDGENITLIEIPDNMKFYTVPSVKHLNNNNEVLIKSGNESWLWSITNSFTELTHYNPQGYYEGQAIAVLDDGTIVSNIGNGGVGSTCDLLFQNESEQSLLKYYHTTHSNNIDASGYQSLSGQFHTDTCLVNNKKQILFWGNFFMENHPFLLTPKNEK